jgi:hypothetical protein
VPDEPRVVPHRSTAGSADTHASCTALTSRQAGTRQLATSEATRDEHAGVLAGHEAEYGKDTPAQIIGGSTRTRALLGLQATLPSPEPDAKLAR